MFFSYRRDRSRPYDKYMHNPSPRSQTIYGSLVDTFGPYFQRYTSGFAL